MIEAQFSNGLPVFIRRLHWTDAGALVLDAPHWFDTQEGCVAFDMDAGQLPEGPPAPVAGDTIVVIEDAEGNTTVEVTNGATGEKTTILPVDVVGGEKPKASKPPFGAGARKAWRGIEPIWTFEGERWIENPQAGNELQLIYAVRSGDSLSRIAREFYDNPAAWPPIYAVPQNRAMQGPSPDRGLFPGDEILIPELDAGFELVEVNGGPTREGEGALVVDRTSGEIVGTREGGEVKKEGLSTGAKVGIAVAGATVVAGGIYFATRKRSRR